MEEFLKIVIVVIFVFLAFDALLHTLKVLRARWWFKEGSKYLAIDLKKASRAFYNAIQWDPNYLEAYFYFGGYLLQIRPI